jgi:MFS family permease
MAIWGFYYDLKSFGTLDFMSRYSKKSELAGNFGTNQSFQALGCLLAPLIAGFLIIDYVDWEPFAAAAVFLILSALFFLLLVLEVRGKKQHLPPRERAPKSFAHELSGWKKAFFGMLPLLSLGAFATVFDAFFVGIGPLLAETMPLEPFDGIFMFAYFLPPLLIGGFVGKITAKFGAKNAALGGLLIAGAILSALPLSPSPPISILLVFLSSAFASLMLPVAQSAYAHLIRRAPSQKKEIQELSDFAGNFGYIIGFMAAGIAADALGNAAAFSALGIAGIAVALALFFMMPKDGK